VKFLKYIGPCFLLVINPVGIDVGLKEFAVLSTGEVIPNPRLYRMLEGKLAKEQKRLSNKEKFSNNQARFALNAEANR
jgi:transposase